MEEALDLSSDSVLNNNGNIYTIFPQELQVTFRLTYLTRRNFVAQEKMLTPPNSTK